MEKLIEILGQYAISHSWSSSMYEIVEHDIKQGRIKTEAELIAYIEQ